MGGVQVQSEKEFEEEFKKYLKKYAKWILIVEEIEKILEKFKKN